MLLFIRWRFLVGKRKRIETFYASAIQLIGLYGRIVSEFSFKTEMLVGQFYVKWLYFILN